MSLARATFLERFSTLDVTIAEPYVQDGALNEVQRNARARLIRNGLAVVGFAFLEDFVRQRAAEILASISASAVPFSDLPEKVKEACTFGLLKAMQVRANLQPDAAAKIAFSQDHARLLASTASSPYQLSDITFGYKSSNIGSEDVAEILRSFRIATPWDAVGILASKVGLSSLSLKDSFENAARRRHRAAHVAGAITPFGDLMGFINEAKAIAFGFDALLSSALIRIKRRNAAYFGGGSIGGNDVVVTLVLSEGGRYKERAWGAVRAKATGTDLNSVTMRAIPRADAAGAALAILDASGQLESWRIPAA
jgi:hypothetical protein